MARSLFRVLNDHINYMTGNWGNPTELIQGSPCPDLVCNFNWLLD